MNEVPIKTACPVCAGRGFAPTGATFKLCGRTHERVGPCQACEGKGTLAKILPVSILSVYYPNLLCNMVEFLPYDDQSS